MNKTKGGGNMPDPDTKNAKPENFADAALKAIADRKADCKKNYPERFAACQEAYACSD